MIIVLTTIFAGKHHFICAESLKTEIKYNVFIDCNYYNNDKNWNSINLEYILFFYIDIRLTKSFCAVIFDVNFIYTVNGYPLHTGRQPLYYHQFIHSALLPFVSPFVAVICI